MFDLSKLQAAVDGKKVYILSMLGMLMLVMSNVLHLDLSSFGVTPSADWPTQVYALLMVMAGKSALKKTEPPAQ